MAISTPVLGVVILLYMLVNFYLAWIGYKSTKQTEDFMVAGRKMHPYILAISYCATFISTSAIVGFGGAAGALGMGLLWLAFMNVAVGIFVAFVIFGKKTRRIGLNLKAVTFPELLGRRFQYVKKIVKFKDKNEESIVARERREAVIRSRRKLAVENGLDPDVVEQLYRNLISHFIEEELKRKAFPKQLIMQSF